LLAKTSGSATPTNVDEMRMLQKLVKQRKESADIYRQENRADLLKTEEEEIVVIERYLPKMMSEEEIKAALKDIITSVGATSAADMGKVMGAASKHFAGKADNKIVSTLVKQMLS
ncbi:MAG TPA: GatB/YqeY domain-containing protein, partial [Bacteroidia bacterium]|nr:GatB/YqeY domain-containing protein [Bacteroidia bacterium]